MNKSIFTEEQIILALMENQLGLSVDEICYKTEVSKSVFYEWVEKYAGIPLLELKRLIQLEKDICKLKQQIVFLLNN